MNRWSATLMNGDRITTEGEYQALLMRLEAIFDANSGTSDGDEAEFLMGLIQRYEKHMYPIDDPDPAAAIAFRLEQE